MALGTEVETEPWKGLQISKKLIGVPQLFVLLCFIQILNHFLLPVGLEK